MTKEELILWRKGRNLTQATLATLLGVKRETVGRWERGEHRVPADALAKMENVAPGAAQKAAAALPAERPYARWRPYPWGNRDYTGAEVDRIRPGVYVWRLVLTDNPDVWEVLQCFARIGSFVRGYDITMPAGAFPDPMGLEAPWARQAFESAWEIERKKLERQQALWREIGIDEKDKP